MRRFLHLPPPSRRVLVRFLLKTWILGACALSRTPWGVARTAAALFAVAALLDSTLALLKREPLNAGHLTYWDEAAAFLLIAATAAAVHG